MDAIPIRRFKPRSSDVVSEVIDGEAVIMDLRNGHYFSARQQAAPVWQSIVSGQSDAEILDRLSGEFDADLDYLRAQLDTYIETLIDHALIVVDVAGGDVAGQDVAGQDAAGDTSAAIARGQRPFPPLVLEAFQDMEELLLLDPIHEVEEETGWPVRKPGDH
jgi:hypothetical protein